MSAPRVLTVSQLTARVKLTIEQALAGVWVSGEISDLAQPRSGHLYFQLKDQSTQIRAVLFRSTAQRLGFELRDGLEVLCRGDVTVYPPSGVYQLVVQSVEPRGLGAKQLALRQLQQRLSAEGLFDARRKRPLPKFPQRIAVVTSPSGAAVRDFVETIRGRWAGASVLIVPTRVQGPGASSEIVRAVATVDRLRPRPDVLVVTRGGGSSDDLWAFNDEAVVRALHACRMPVVSAVGHEIDVTLADLVADFRAMTPTEAAQRVVPSLEEVMRLLNDRKQRLAAALRSRARRARERLESLARRPVLRRPLDRLHDLARHLDTLEARGQRALRQHVRRAREAWRADVARLQALSPLAVLSRGYTVTTTESGEVVRDASQLAPGDLLITRFAEGRTVSRVQDSQPGEPQS